MTNVQSPAQLSPRKGLRPSVVVAIVTAAVVVLGGIGWFVFSSSRDEALKDAVIGTWDCFEEGVTTIGAFQGSVQVEIEVQSEAFVLRLPGDPDDPSNTVTGQWSVDRGHLSYSLVRDDGDEKAWSAEDMPDGVPDAFSLLITQSGRDMPPARLDVQASSGRSHVVLTAYPDDATTVSITCDRRG